MIGDQASNYRIRLTVSPVTSLAKVASAAPGQPAAYAERWAHRSHVKHKTFGILLFFLPTLLLAKGPSPAQLEAVKAAEALGGAIYAQDDAVARASDALSAAVDAERRAQVIGWVVRSDKESQLVTFVGKREGKYFAVFQVDVKPGQALQVVTLDPPRPLISPDLEMFNARQTALRAMPKSCPSPYNTVVLPGSMAAFDGWLVYLLAASADPNQVPVGGHVRARVSSDGGTVIAMEPLSKSCLTLSLTSDTGEHVLALYMTHLMSDAPTEAHAFLNLLYGVDFYVATETSVWGITKGAIRYVGANKNKGK
jgi:hypothetical protein